MKTAGCIVALVGLALVVVGPVVIWRSVSGRMYHGMMADPLGSLTLAPGGSKATTPILAGKSQEKYRLVVWAELKGVEQSEHGIARREYEFPIKYRVMDNEGATIHEATESLSSEHPTTQDFDTLYLATRPAKKDIIRQGFASFAAPANGLMVVEAEVQADAKHASQAEAVHVDVRPVMFEEDPTEMFGRRFMVAPILSCAGFPVMVLGLVLFVVGLFKRPQATG